MSSKEQKIASYNPNWVGEAGDNLFGLPFTCEESDVVVIPAPWDVTVSSFEGTSGGPATVLSQSSQIDLYDEVVPAPWKAGIAMDEMPDSLLEKNTSLRQHAKRIIEKLEEDPDGKLNDEYQMLLATVNKGCEDFFDHIFNRSKHWLAQQKLVVLLGGDHSTPLGLMKALSEIHPEFGILQIDAHADLRPNFMGFSHSHASIMYNASGISSISRFVQVGLRDLCEQEALHIKDHPEKFKAFYNRAIQRRRFEGETWHAISHDIISHLPDKVYISFDVDGLDPSLCPHTGTPVPGGLSYDEVLYLFEMVVNSGKTIIGFDLVETGQGSMDGIFSCRLLYKTIALMLKSNGKA